MIVGVLSVDGGSSSLGIDAANGNSLTWTNRLLDQDPNTEMGASFDDAPATSTLTPSVNWGTMSSSPKWAAVVAAFKDAGGGGTTYNETISEGVTTGESSAVNAVANPALTESTTAGETSAALVTAVTSLTESTTPGDSSSALVTTDATLTESATAGDSSAVAATINADSSEGVTPGDSYADSGPTTYNETISEGVTLGDSYATDSTDIPVGRGRPRREPRRLIRPDELPAIEASILIRQPAQGFSLAVEISAGVEIEMDQGSGLFEVEAESGTEIDVEMQAAAQFVEALLSTVPVRRETAQTFAKHKPMLVRIEIEQAEQIEYELA